MGLSGWLHVVYYYCSFPDHFAGTRLKPVNWLLLVPTSYGRVYPAEFPNIFLCFHNRFLFTKQLWLRKIFKKQTKKNNGPKNYADFVANYTVRTKHPFSKIIQHQLREKCLQYHERFNT